VNELRELLLNGLSMLALKLEERALGRLLRYLELLRQWNQKFNLTAIRDPRDMVIKHILDSLAVFEHARARRLLDVGTGAGVPGLPLLIAGAVDEVLLIDSVGKKIRFCQHVIDELDLKGAEALQERVEKIPAARGGDVVISRAFASLAEFARLAGHLIEVPGRGPGRLLAMKAQLKEEELGEVKKPWRVSSIVELKVPFLDAERRLIELRRR
jgi:16S rRNA (guanine527-N7)-methyltransferase